MTVFLAAVVCQPVSAVSFFSSKVVPASMMSEAFTNATSFVGKHKFATATFGLAALFFAHYNICGVGYQKRLTKDIQRLVSDVNKEIVSQKSYKYMNIPCDPKVRPNWEFNPKNYPYVDKSIVELANQYIYEKNHLFVTIARPHHQKMLDQERLDRKKNINMILKKFKDYVHKNTHLSTSHMTSDELVAGFKEITNFLQLRYETLA